LRYGLDGCPPQSLAAVGALLGISRERVRQIQQKAEERLRNMICEKYRDLILPGDEAVAGTAEHGESQPGELKAESVSIRAEPAIHK
jgi:hypothetical protein